MSLEEDFVKFLTSEGAIKFSRGKGDLFVFKMGRKSPNYVNMGHLTDGKSLNKIKTAFAQKIMELLKEGRIEDFDFVFGLAYRGITLAALACEGLSELYGINRRLIYDRKEMKAYGDKKADQIIIGASHFKPGSRILVVDDVITTGETKTEAIEKLKALGDYKIAGMVIAVDRQEKMGDAVDVQDLSASEMMARDYGINVFPIIKMSDIFEVMKDKVSAENKRLWVEYYEKYGAVKLAS
ncbi:MAG: orotate phosphoribosyltransferase [Candidatus Aenigmarchaeota archaeon]|nr:orotate phosphoribosyltransferase [Candidatus Aenigmarchaeota archaeon]